MATPVADHSAAKGRNPTSHPFSSLRSKVDKLSTNLSRLGVAVSTTLNPNHRHDEEWEKEVDAKMEAIRDEHRYRSFAGERDGNVVKFHVDGHGESRARDQAGLATKRAGKVSGRRCRADQGGREVGKEGCRAIEGSRGGIQDLPHGRVRGRFIRLGQTPSCETSLRSRAQPR